MHHRESSSNKLISVVIYTANPKFVLLFSFLVSADVYDAQMSPLEAVVLNAMMTGSSILNFRAHFLNQLPDMSPLAGMLTHLNLSFNDLWVSTDLKLSFVFYIRRTVWELLKDKLMTSPGPYLAITQKYLSFTSLCLALKKLSGLTKNGGRGGGWGPEIGLKAFETFCHIFRNLWTSLDMIEPSTKNLQPLNKTILTGELVSDSDLYNIPNAFYQFFILKIL